MVEQSPPRSSNTHRETDAFDCSSSCLDARRRRVLIAVGTAGSVALAGCTDEDTDDEADVASYDVTFTDDDEETETSIQEDEEILYPALDAGVEIPYTCEVGSCGECTVRYDGDANEVVTHEGNDYLDDEQIEAGWVLTCVAYPQDDSELEVAHPDDA